MCQLSVPIRSNGLADGLLVLLLASELVRLLFNQVFGSLLVAPFSDDHMVQVLVFALRCHAWSLVVIRVHERVEGHQGSRAR
jgi:hypothetical protein